MKVGWNYYGSQIKKLLSWELENLLKRSEKIREKFDHNLEHLEIINNVKQIISTSVESLKFFTRESQYFVSSQIKDGIQF